jgi:localization factor PodJL
MNRAAAWSVRGVGRETRDAAQEAARRAGMSLGEWLDEVIADQAADQGVDPEDFDQEERLQAIGDRLSALSRRQEPAPRETQPRRSRQNDDDEREFSRPRAPVRQPTVDDSRRAEELLDAAINKFESRAAKSDERTMKAFDSVATWMERSQDVRRDEHETLQTVVERLESLEERIINQQAALAAANRPVVRVDPRAEDRARDLDERMNDLARRIEAAAADKSRREAPRSRPRLDMNDAVTQIARRRQELDARTGAPDVEAPRRGWRNFGIETPAAAKSAEPMPPARDIAAENAARENASREAVARERAAIENAARERAEREIAAREAAAREAALRERAERERAAMETAARESAARDRAEKEAVIREAAARELAARERAEREAAANALQGEIRKLSQRLDEMRREQSEKREPPANIDALRAELAAMSRSLADLAPRNAVVALEGAIRDLTQRVAASRENGARENLLAPVDGLVAELRESVRAHDPRKAVEALQREIGALGAKVDGIAHASISPLAFERIRQQTEEARNLLATLAQKPAPFDRLERQIGALADRVDRLSISPTPQVESAEVVASLAEARAQVERSTPASALTSIEHRLEQIAAKMDQALQRPAPAPMIGAQALEDLSRRIDGVRESIETQRASPSTTVLDTNGLEKAISEISAKLDRPAAPTIDPNAFQTMIHDLGSRIDRRVNPIIDTGPLEQVLRRMGERPVAVDTRPLEGLMREISAKLEGAHPAAVDMAPLEGLMREINVKLESARPAIVDMAPLESLMREINRKLESARPPIVDTAPLEGLMSEINRKLESARPAIVDTTPLADLMREISAKLDRPAPPALDPVAFENMIHDLGVRIDRRVNPVIDTRPLEQTLRSLHDKIEQNTSPQLTADRIDQAVQALSERMASRSGGTPDIAALEELIRGLEHKFENARFADGAQALYAPSGGASSSGALEHMVGELLAQLDQTRQALREAGAPAVADETLARGLADLRVEQTNADRRIQSTLGGVHDMLEALVDRIGQVEDEVARGAPPSRDAVSPSSAAARYAPTNPAPAPSSAALNSMDATIREKPVFAPARPQPETRADKAQDSRDVPVAPASSMRSIDGSDFLIEPGAGAPLRALEKDAISGANPKSAVNAHIAAARRAAQAALAETANNVARDGAKAAPASGAAAASSGGLEQAKAFFAARRRPILLGVALVALLAIAFVELGVMHQPAVQKSEIEELATPKLADATPAKDAGKPSTSKTETRALDTTPVGSINAAPGGPTTKFLTPAPSELVAAIPSSTPQGLRDAAAAGDPAAQHELASRFAEGRTVTRDPHAAAQWYERAATQGFPPAQYRLGALYEKGIGVARDPALAKAWYKKAADAGNARAMHNLAVLIAEGAGSIKPDYSEAADWFLKASRLGVKDSQYNLAILYARGMGITQDLGQSWLWFSLAAQQGDADAGKKRDEVAAKMDAKALADIAPVLANFHAATPNPAANEVPAPPGGWDFAKMSAAPAQPAPQSANPAPRSL